MSVSFAQGIAILIYLLSGSGYAGSVYHADITKGPWYADGFAIFGATAQDWTMTSAYEGALTDYRAGVVTSNAIEMWMLSDLSSTYKSNGGWWDPRRQVSVTSGKVTSLADRFAIRNLAQTTDANRPTLSNIGGFDALAVGKSNNVDAARGWRGPIFKVLALGAVPDSITKAKIEGLLAHRNATSSLLPNSHLYKILGPVVSGDYRTLALGSTEHDVLMTLNDGSTAEVIGTGNFTLPYSNGQIADVIYAPRVSGMDTPPLFATISARVSTLAFADDFDDPASVDFEGVENSSKKWFRRQHYGQGIAPASYFSVGGSVLRVGDGTSVATAILHSSISANNAQHYIGNAFGGAEIYYEARIKFDPTKATLADRWPAFWSMSVEHVYDDVYPEDVQWAGQADGYRHFIEVDFMEIVHTPKASVAGTTYYQSTAHDWSGIYGSTGGGWPFDVSNGKNGTGDSNRFELGQALDANWHLYGCLIVRQKGTKPGYIQWFFDRKSGPKIYFKGAPTAPPLSGTGTSQSFSPTTPELAAETYSIVDQHRLQLSLETDNRWPMDVDWVRVWRSD